MSAAVIPSALRRLVHERAHGQCEYCLTPELVTLVPHAVDHIIAQKHGGATTAENLALACSLLLQLNLPARMMERGLLILSGTLRVPE
jgi:hypothetical protein